MAKKFITLKIHGNDGNILTLTDTTYGTYQIIKTYDEPDNFTQIVIDEDTSRARIIAVFEFLRRNFHIWDRLDYYPH